MRMIDADKVKEYILNEGFYCDTDADKMHTANEIDELFPTVKAIPIEWIKSKIDAILNSHPDGNGETEILCKLLYDWEKENEKEL